jgi:hypothetical protein
MNRRYKSPVWQLGLVILIAFLMHSCYTEQSLGKQFVRGLATDQPSIWFVGASYLFKTCTMEEDSLLEPCSIIHAANDSLLLENYNSNFAKQLEASGYRIFAFDEYEEFLNQKGLRLIINIAQLELEELKEMYTDQETFEEQEYRETIPVRKLNLNSWIEVSLVDSTKSKQEMYFASNSMGDIIDGYFLQHDITGNVTYYYRRYGMKPSLVSKLAMDAGAEHAGKIFDVWMNRYIEKHDSPTYGEAYLYETRGYYHYDPATKKVIRINPEKALQRL